MFERIRAVALHETPKGLVLVDRDGPENTFVSGDSAEDMEAARAACCSGLFIGPDHSPLLFPRRQRPS
jgi:hypothetical protein